VFQSGKIAIKGLPAWFAHRGYHGLAMPSWERKIRVIWGWVNNFFLGRDIVSLAAVANPRAAFEEFASRPKPPVEAAPVAAAPKAVAPKVAKTAATKAPAAKAAATDVAPKAAKAPVKRAPKKVAAETVEVAEVVAAK
jgi:NADH dehydrogenase